MEIARKLPRSQRVVSVLVPLGSFVFFASTLLASIPYYRGKPFNPREAVISRLQDPYQNPNGYLVAAVGTVVFAVLTLPAVWLFFVKLRQIHRTMAYVGTVLIALGLLGAAALGCLAPFSSSFDTSHTILALSIFFALSAGLTLCLGLAAWSTRRLRLWLAAVVQCAALPVLLYMVFTPDFPPERSFLSSLAFLEWALCLITGASILVLTVLLTSKIGLSPSLGSNLRDPSEQIQEEETQTR
jgi:cytochrome bd-type quinol oxidase subunit 2